MRMVRNILLAITIGVFGGVLVSVMSYYGRHRDDGIANTLLAVADSARTIREAYADNNQSDNKKGYDWNVDMGVLAGGRKTSSSGEYIDDKIPALSDAVMSAFSDISGKDNYGTVSDVNVADVVDDVFDDESGETDLMKVNDGLDIDDPYAGILRFHVRANSDSDKDQELKLAVRDDVVSMLKPLMTDCVSVAESKEVVINNLSNIYKTAVDTITEQGYDYPVKVYVTVEEFPAKTYGDLTFPAGRYQALRIDIGNALGQNWWCVMYPPLCFIDDATVVVSKEGKRMLRDNMSDEEYEELFQDNLQDADYRKLLLSPDTDIKGESIIYNTIKKWLE